MRLLITYRKRGRVNHNVNIKNIRNPCETNCVPVIYQVGLLQNIKLTILLLEYGESVNSASHLNGNTLLHRGVALDEKDVVDLLLSRGAKVNAVDNDGVPPLHAAASAGRKDMVELLLSHGAKINMQDRYGFTALYVASMHAHRDVVELLLSRGADVNMKTNNIINAGSTILHVAVRSESKPAEVKDIVELLLAHGADMNVKDRNGCIPLQYAVENNLIDIVELFLKYAERL